MPTSDLVLDRDACTPAFVDVPSGASWRAGRSDGARGDRDVASGRRTARRGHARAADDDLPRPVLAVHVRGHPPRAAVAAHSGGAAFDGESRLACPPASWMARNHHVLRRAASYSTIEGTNTFGGSEAADAVGPEEGISLTRHRTSSNPTYAASRRGHSSPNRSAPREGQRVRRAARSFASMLRPSEGLGAARRWPALAASG